MSGEEVTLVAVVKPVPGKEQRLQQLTQEYYSKNLRLQLLLHKENDGAEGRYSLVERYKTAADLEKHCSDPLHAEMFQTFEREGILAEVPIVFVGKAVAGHFTR